MNKIIHSLFILFIVTYLTGCKTQSVYKEPKTIDLVEVTKKASMTLSAGAQESLPVASTILSTSLSDINNLNTTSTLGRILSEQLSSRLSDQGYKLKEIKMRSNVFISHEQGGEFTFSRKLAAISKNHNARAILTGTYAIGSRTVYVNARLIDTSNNIVISTVDFQLPLDSDMRALTRPKYTAKPSTTPEKKTVTRIYPSNKLH